MRWILILGYQQWKSWMCLFDLLFERFVLIGSQPFSLYCKSQSRRVFWLLIDSLRIQLFRQTSLVNSALRGTSSCVTSFSEVLVTLLQLWFRNWFSTQWICHANLILSYFYHQRLRCNQFSVPEFDYYPSTFSNKGWFLFPIVLILYQFWWFNT
jgi:hypothetical protein